MHKGTHAHLLIIDRQINRL